jgi:hypothetical protein
MCGKQKVRRSHKRHHRNAADDLQSAFSAAPLRKTLTPRNASCSTPTTQDPHPQECLLLDPHYARPSPPGMPPARPPLRKTLTPRNASCSTRPSLLATSICWASGMKSSMRP